MMVALVVVVVVVSVCNNCNKSFYPTNQSRKNNNVYSLFPKYVETMLTDDLF